MSDSLNDYKSRQKEWRDITVNQLSITNNLLTTLVLGYTGLIFDKTVIQNATFFFNSKIDWNLTFYFISLNLIIISLLFGIAVMLTRLYDFRISRQLAFVRLRIYKSHKKTLKGYDADFSEPHFMEMLKSLYRIIFINLNFTTLKEIKNFKRNSEKVIDKFESLQKLSRNLGSASWRWTKLQLAFTAFSILTYIIYLITS